MSDTVSTSIYIELKGNWGAGALQVAQKAITRFFDEISYDTGQAEIDENGLAYTYDAICDDEQLEELLRSLDTGHAYIVTIDVGDGMNITSYVKQPQSKVQVFKGLLSEDPFIPFSKRRDATFLDALEKAIELDATAFTAA